jgi:lipoprotein signal peptidase
VGSGHGSWALIGSSVLAVAVSIAASRARPGMAACGSGLIVGGAIGNVLSRLASAQHCVTDYLAVGRLFVANVQDVAITVGVILWVATFLQKDESRGREHI